MKKLFFITSLLATIYLGKNLSKRYGLLIAQKQDLKAKFTRNRKGDVV